MAYELLLSIIEQFGYAALFLVLCLGLIGLPIPNEAVVMTGGALAASGTLSMAPAYTMAFLGICSAMTFGYSLGRFSSAKLSNWFRNKKNINRFLIRSEELIEKHGGYAISISLCLPFLRHVTPYVVGLNRMKYTRFALYAYPSALIWTTFYFILGSYVGDGAQNLAGIINQYGLWVLLGLILTTIMYAIYRYLKLKNNKSSVERPM